MAQTCLCSICQQTQNITGIDVQRFLQELNKIKHKFINRDLSDKEREYICLSLAEYNKREITYFFYSKQRKIPTLYELENWEEMPRKISELNADMSKTVHRYIRELMQIKRFPTWPKVIQFLKDKGYQTTSSNMIPPSTISIQLLIDNDATISKEEIIRLIKELIGQHYFSNIKILKID